jgi:hypothetical protein
MRTSIFILLLSFSLHTLGQSDIQSNANEKFQNRKSIQLLKSLKNQKAVAITLNATLGYLGVHRMYLGTDVKVPVLYSATAGGGGILWLVDLGVLVAVKDIKPFMNNPHFFMWNSTESK